MRARKTLAALALSAVAFVGLISEEGFSPKAYIPIPGDVWTLGFGSTNNVKQGDTITPVKGVQRAMSDVQKFEGALKQCVTVDLHQYEYDAYVSLAYNIGPSAFCKSTLVKKLNQRDYNGACREILRWNKSKGRVIKGLVLRREREYQQCIGMGMVS